MSWSLVWYRKCISDGTGLSPSWHWPNHPYKLVLIPLNQRRNGEIRVQGWNVYNMTRTVNGVHETDGIANVHKFSKFLKYILILLIVYYMYINLNYTVFNTCTCLLFAVIHIAWTVPFYVYMYTTIVYRVIFVPWVFFSPFYFAQSWIRPDTFVLKER